MNHELFMERCLQLAANARGKTSPNPMVGAVVVHKNKIIGEGWHHKAGEPHAEVNAIDSVSNKELLQSSTIYVSLEPCAHFGKTPPCADLIIDMKIPEVVIGTRDPFTQVNGRGIEKLRAAGIKVTEGILEKQCRQLNVAFFTYHTKKRPYVILKWAQSPDGFMDIQREGKIPGVNWITQPETKVMVHQWRSEVDAILVGATTIENDDPELTVRELKGKNPIRLIIDPQARLKPGAKVFNDAAPTYIFTSVHLKEAEQSHYLGIDFDQNPIAQILDDCYAQGIQSVLVEGGAHTLQSFIKEEAWDEGRIFTGIDHIGEGLEAPSLSITPYYTEFAGKDILNYYRP